MQRLTLAALTLLALVAALAFFSQGCTTNTTTIVPPAEGTITFLAGGCTTQDGSLNEREVAIVWIVVRAQGVTITDGTTTLGSGAHKDLHVNGIRTRAVALQPWDREWFPVPPPGVRWEDGDVLLQLSFNLEEEPTTGEPVTYTDSHVVRGTLSDGTTKSETFRVNRMVYAVGEGGDSTDGPSEGDGSNPVDATAPSTPTGFAAIGGQGTVTFSWTRSPESDYAGAYVYESVGGSWVRVSSPANSPYTISGVSVGSHTYRITAVDGCGNESTPTASATVNVTSGGGGGGDTDWEDNVSPYDSSFRSDRDWSDPNPPTAHLVLLGTEVGISRIRGTFGDPEFVKGVEVQALAWDCNAGAWTATAWQPLKTTATGTVLWPTAAQIAADPNYGVFWLPWNWNGLRTRQPDGNLWTRWRISDEDGHEHLIVLPLAV